jgi:DNA primase
MTHEELRQLEMETKQKKAVAKYINSPSSVVFIKKKTLFGIDLAAPYCEEAGCVIMVEGYFDVIACHQANVRNVVASMGTSVTLEQLLSAAKLTSKRTIVLLLDNDEAGRKAAARAKKIADKHHEEAMKTLRLRPDGDVVDEEDIRQEHFITLKRATIDDALSFIRREKLKTTLRRVYDPQQKPLKDCADICEIFPAESARKIIRHIADSAVLVDHDAEATTHAASDKDTSLPPSPPSPVKTKSSPSLECKPTTGRESTWKVNAQTSPTTVAVEEVLPPVRRKYTPRVSSPPPNATRPPPVNAYPRKYVKQSSSPSSSSSSYARTQQSSTPVIRRDRHPQPQQSYDDIV